MLEAGGDVMAVLCSIFPEARLLSRCSCVIDIGGSVTVSATDLGEIQKLSVASPCWSRREEIANNARLTSFISEGGASDSVGAILWCIEQWGSDKELCTECEDTAETIAAIASATLKATPSSCELRRWLGFIGFYTPSIRRAFIEEARRVGLTGFLMPGKPAVAALEGDRRSIDHFVSVTRTQLFASVPPASRKMSVMLEESGEVGVQLLRAFSTFDEIELPCETGLHVRQDTADLGALRALLDSRGLAHIPLSALIP
jgi:hypothetical protein